MKPMTQQFSRELQSWFYPYLQINAERCEFIFIWQLRNNVKFNTYSLPSPLVDHHTKDATRLATGSAMKQSMFLPQLTWVFHTKIKQRSVQIHSPEPCVCAVWQNLQKISTERTGWRWISTESPQNWCLPHKLVECFQSAKHSLHKLINFTMKAICQRLPHLQR